MTLFSLLAVAFHFCFGRVTVAAVCFVLFPLHVQMLHLPFLPRLAPCPSSLFWLVRRLTTGPPTPPWSCALICAVSDPAGYPVDPAPYKAPHHSVLPRRLTAGGSSPWGDFVDLVSVEKTLLVCCRLCVIFLCCFEQHPRTLPLFCVNFVLINLCVYDSVYSLFPLRAGL